MRAKRLLVSQVLAGSAIAVCSIGQTPIFRAGVDLVRLDVTVLDRDRRPVHGLSESDFVVREDSKVQKIEAFSEISLPDEPLRSAKWMSVASPDITTNRISDGRIVVMVLDDAVIPQDLAMVEATKAIGRNVIDGLGANDLACVLYTAANRGKAQNFTTDRGRLHAAIDKFDAGFASFSIDADDSPFFENSVGVIRDVSTMLISLQQRRKTLIYVSTGIPIDPAANTPILIGRGGASNLGQREAMMRLYDDLQEAFRSAQRSNVAIYAINPAGPGSIFHFAMNRLLLQRVPAQVATEKALNLERLSLDSLQQLSANTGGRASVSSDHYSEAVAQVFRDSESYYMLGFRESDPKPQGKFSRLDVSVSRPGLEVLSRTVNFTPKPDQALEKSTATTRAIAGFLPIPDQSIRVSAVPFASPVGNIPGASERSVGDAIVAIVLSAEVPAPRERVIEHVEMLTRAFSIDGDLRGSHNQTVEVTVRPPGESTEGRTPLSTYKVLGQIALKPGRYQLRLAMNNTAQAKVGSVFADVDVPDFRGLPISMSGVVLSAPSAPVSAPKDELASIVPIVPTTLREFDPMERIETFLRVYEGGKSPKRPSSLVVKIVDDHDATVFSATHTLAANAFSAGSADFRFVLPSERLHHGQYLLTFEASSQGAVARRQVIFAIR